MAEAGCRLAERRDRDDCRFRLEREERLDRALVELLIGLIGDISGRLRPSRPGKGKGQRQQNVAAVARSPSGLSANS